MRRILVTGAKGQLGSDVIQALKETGYQPLGVDRQQMDLTHLQEIKKVLTMLNPDAIIHCGAYTAVDQAEIERETCYQINAEATKALATYAAERAIPFIYLSTDYVFDGTKEGEYVETDQPNPINVYGASKLKGEHHVQNLLDKYFIVRISWVFGVKGNNFVKTMLRLSEQHHELNVISDQVGSPTATADLAPLLINMLKSDKYGIYHVTNEGFCSWADFAKEIFHVHGVETKINPITTCQFQAKAARPMNSKMSKNKLVEAGFIPLPPWQKSLENWRIADDKLRTK